MKRPAFFGFVLAVFFSAAMWAQHPSGTPGQQPNGEPGMQRAPQSASSGGGIVADNLDRVAATAQQILEILNRDAGLMVELKRWIARDAGESGQVLEESDLSEDALAQRLKQDLRTRVMATRLLRKYGYLLPKLNPDSEQAQEEKLVLQERAQELARAAERNSRLRDQTPAQLDADCSSRQSDCDMQERTPAPVRTSSPPIDRPRMPSDQTVPSSPAPSRQPEILTSPRETRIETAAEDSTGILLPASSPVYPNESSSHLGRGEARTAIDAASSLAPSNDTLGAADPSAHYRNSGVIRSDPSVPALRYPKRTTDAYPFETEPVHMARRPSPYADVPSLYDLYVQASPSNKPTERFGLQVFRYAAVNPDMLPMDLPVGPDYVLGPGDALSIDMWGGVSQRLFQTVDREGKLVLPEAGPLLVSGRSLGEAQEAVQRALRTQFRDVSADVSLLKLRTVRVYVVGEVATPGAYDVSSLSTPLNALFAAGGVTTAGSLRHLQHYRGNRLVEEVDAYDLLLHGVRGNMERLENGDSLRVPPLGPSIAVDGMVRRPATYELRGETNLSQVLDLAGGLLPAAALRHIEVQRLEAHEKRTMLSLEIGEGTDKEALRATLDKFRVSDGDEIHIFPIAPYNESAVYLQGHVLRPGRYSYREGIKLADVISSYKDLLPEPAAHYAEIIRITAPDYRPVVHGFDLAAALAHPENAPKLEPLDTVRIFGRYDLEQTPEVLVTGEVNLPGNYRTSGEQHFRDAVYQAGGLTPGAWLDSAQLFRAMPDGSEKVFSVSLRDALAGDALNNILIEPRDHIVIHRQPERVSPPTVYVRGDVARPGRYPLAANMRVSDLLRAAGGLLRSANAEGGDLTHYSVSGTAAAHTQVSGEEKVNLTAALQGGASDDLALRDGDVLTVPQQGAWKDVGASVSISGEVAKPGVYGIQPGERLSSLLRRAGGLLPTAYPQAAVFTRNSVYELQQKSRQELIQRVEQESTVVKTAINTTGTEEAALQQAAIQQRQRVLEALRNAPISGRLVIHLQPWQRGFEGSADDIHLHAGDSLEIPKQPGFVLVIGQVYNTNAITYTPRKNAAWYLSRAGGATGLGNKSAIFIIRANGSVTSGKSGPWSGGVLSSEVGPGDTIVVPEKVTVGGNAWRNLVAIAQIAQAGALAAAVAIP